MFKKAVKVLPRLVIAAAAVPVVTVAVCLTLTKALGHVPAEFILPQISLTGNHAPERWLYLLGFGGTALLMAFMFLVLHTEVLPAFLRRGWNALATALALALSAGLLVQALFCLQEDFADAQTSSATPRTPEALLAWLQPTTLLHLGGAFVFFACALVYVLLMVLLLCTAGRRASAVSAGADIQGTHTHALRSPFAGFWYRWKVGCAAAFLVCLGVSDFGGALFDDTRLSILAGALGQWSCVLSFILFCLSYSFDLRRFLALNPDFFASETTSARATSSATTTISAEAALAAADTQIPALTTTAKGNNSIHDDDDDSDGKGDAVPLASLGTPGIRHKMHSSTAPVRGGSAQEKQSLIANDGLFTIDDEEEDGYGEEGENGTGNATVRPEDLM